MSRRSSSSRSLDEKERKFELGDPQAKAVEPVEDEPTYAPIKTEKTPKDLDVHVDANGSRGTLSRLQSRTSAITDISDVDSDAKSTRKKRKWNPLKWGAAPPIPQTREVCPEHKASVFSRLTWHWMQPLMTVGYKRPLEKNDIWTVNPNRSADLLAKKLDDHFKKYLDQGDERPLLKAMFQTFKWEACISILSSVFPS